MDPYLEHPGLWPDVHNSLIAAIREALAPLVAPRYYVGLQRRTYLLRPDDLVFIGRPDLAVLARRRPPEEPSRPQAGVTVLEVDVPLTDEVDENYLEVRDVPSGELVTVVELRSPVNKLGSGRAEYLAKRDHIFRSRTNLVEIDLLRAGEPMPVMGTALRSDYRLLVSRGLRRPKAQLYSFGMRQAIPSFQLPLQPADDEPLVDLNLILHSLYERARFDLALDYTQPTVPPLAGPDADWAQALMQRPD
jgi:Protein of unknown function (DUF4058)